MSPEAFVQMEWDEFNQYKFTPSLTNLHMASSGVESSSELMVSLQATLR